MVVLLLLLATVSLGMLRGENRIHRMLLPQSLVAAFRSELVASQ
jgi:hypothetical protein